MILIWCQSVTFLPKIGYSISVFKLLALSIIIDMGNDANCSRLCEKKSDGPHTHDDILMTEYIVPCQICN
jgi:hypothetical protein